MDFTLSEGQYNLVYNSFSFVIASMGAALVFFLLMRSRVAPRHRMALTLSTLVVGIALYHYVRIFGSWSDAFSFTDGRYVQDGEPFNEGYRYVDWLLTVPLLLAELVVVLKLSKNTTRSMLIRLSIAAVAMIALGWPGEVSDPDSTARTLWAVASTIPFIYILYVLFVELGRSLGRQSPSVRKTLDGMRYILLATWGVYPLAYMAPSVIDDAAAAEVARQVGYSIADVLAKPLFGLLVLAIALSKSRDEGYVEAGDDAGADSRVAVPDDAGDLVEA
ncbi:MAG: bacteriorhodopsin-like [Ilumatobacter sp.]|uniref:bacteriorhodopsin-like n=1 Tax=Ilumatobacter sp. TaxID=1967498 RepID=UPI0026349BF9|nr:bacteriorhodopsin-like [Ilumatobacter sp.]MDJ0769635.1 bacteriorhodopsin-like [Ilumatobacter sp.]